MKHLSANDLISRMTPTTMVAMLGDMIEMGNLDTVDGEIISVVAYELIACSGISASIDMLNEAGVAHPLIDAEIQSAQEEEDVE